MPVISKFPAAPDVGNSQDRAIGFQEREDCWAEKWVNRYAETTITLEGSEYATVKLPFGGYRIGWLGQYRRTSLTCGEQ